jgi:hypothetical protein
MRSSTRRLHLLVEGQTEEALVRDTFRPHLEQCGWLVSHSIIKTRQPASGPAHRGGLSTWTRFEREVRLLLKDSSLSVLTTLVDYYGFPQDAPGMGDRPKADPFERVAHVERALSGAIGDDRFVPHLVLHEVEAWVFAAADQLGLLYADRDLPQKLRNDVAEAGGPELVDDTPTNSPSKRLRRYWPGYVKTLDGPLAVAELGLTALRQQCPHVDQWIRGFES